jgi:predicted DNA-binding protein
MYVKGNGKRCYTSFSLEPTVAAYIDDLSERMGMNKSWVVNTIIHEYAKVIEDKNLKPLSSREALIRINK